MPETHAQSQLVLWLKGNILAMLVFSMSLIGSAAGGVWATSRWVNSLESRVVAIQKDITSAQTDAVGIHGDIVSLDHRVNELRAKVYELDNLEAQATRDLKGRLDTIDALSRFNTERAFQPPLPQAPRR